MTQSQLIAKYWPLISGSIGESQRLHFESAIENAHHEGWKQGFNERGEERKEPEATYPAHAVTPVS